MASMFLSPWPEVRQGCRGWPVSSLQYLLRSHGHGVTVDDAFGTETEAAVRAFQRSRTLTVDGVVTSDLWPALVVQVQRGSKGDAVRAVQDGFTYRAMSPETSFKIDGIFGPRTEAAVRGFQEALGIPADGVVGPVTWQAMVSGMLSF